MLAKICESSEPKTASSFCGLQSYHLSTEAVNVFLSAKSPDDIKGICEDFNTSRYCQIVDTKS